MTVAGSGEGHERPLCGAVRKQAEGPCKHAAGWGTVHVGIGNCKLHGGSTRNHVIAAERIQFAELAVRYSVPREVHPLTGVLEQYHRYAGQVTYLEGRVNALPEEELFWGVESETDRRNPDDDGGERLRTGAAAEFEVKRKAGPNALLEQFDRVQREFAKLGVDIVRIGLETASDALASQFATRMQRMLDELMVECAAAAAATPDGPLVDLFRALMVAKIAAFAGVEPAAVKGVAA